MQAEPPNGNDIASAPHDSSQTYPIMADSPLKAASYAFPRLQDYVQSYGLSLRLSAPADNAFLYELFLSIQGEQFAFIPWPEEQKQAFIQTQFELQNQQYRTWHPEGFFAIVEWNGAAIGKLYLAFIEAELRIVDISLLPAYRNQGIGSILLAGTIAEARHLTCTLGLNVFVFNPASNLYMRMGFSPAGEPNGAHQKMEWHPQAECHSPTGFTAQS